MAEGAVTSASDQPPAIVKQARLRIVRYILWPFPTHFAGGFAGFPQKMNVPRVVEVTISIAPSLFKSTANIVDPTPDRL